MTIIQLACKNNSLYCCTHVTAIINISLSSAIILLLQQSN